VRIVRLTALVIVAATATAATPASKTYPPVPSLTVKHCTEVLCSVNVDIVPALTPSLKCTIDVDPPILDLRGGPSVQRIEWTITSPLTGKWPDPTDPYLPVQFERDAQHAISNMSVSGNTVAVTYTRPIAGGHHYAYGLSAKHPTSGKLCDIDPWVLD
jgi:hypothetical protein